MNTVIWVTAKGDKAAVMKMSDDTLIWTPDKTKADELIGKPIPEDWTQKQGEYGPQAFPPREKKGGFGGAPAAFRNTKEGQAIEQDQMNRRTALMQAVQWGAQNNNIDWHGPADAMYAWLSGDGVVTPSPSSDKGEAPASPSTPPPSQDGHGGDPAEGGVDAYRGEGATTSPDAAHVHEWVPAPREGWVLCICGKAEKATKVGI